MKKVLVFGTFDLLHQGHTYFLEHAAKYGKLYVVVSRDETVREVKGIEPLNNENKRLKNVQELKCVHKAVLGNFDDKYKVVKDINPDIICLGYDQTHFVDNLKTKANIIRIDAYMPEKYKSFKLRAK